MRLEALQYLACPACGGDLAVTDAVNEGPHVMSGSLVCAGCKAAYPIEGGVPRIIVGARADSTATAARFAAEWKIFSHMSSYQEEWFRRWVDPLGPDDFRGKVVFEGGCGKGRHTVVSSSWGVKAIVSLDLGDAIYEAFAHTRDLENAHVVQADLLRPPVKRVFDLAFSVGVLHHLPDPRAGFKSLRSLVRPGGKLAIWVYGAESNEWITRWVTPIRERVTARMPPKLLYWLTYPPTVALCAALSLYRNRDLSDHLPYRDYLRVLATVPLREVHSIVYDQLVTPIAHYLPEQEVRSWLDGLDDVTMAWHNKNSWRATARVS